MRCVNCNHQLIQFKGVWLHQGTTNHHGKIIKIASQKCYRFKLDGWKCDCIEPAR